MADFQANIRAVLDTGDIENQIKNEINNRQVNLTNVQIDTASLINQIQNALSNHQFSLTLNLQNLNNQINNLGQQMQQNLNQSVGGVITRLNNNLNGQHHPLFRTDALGQDITTVEALGNALEQMNFRDEDIQRVTQNLNAMDIQIKKITYDLNDNGGIRVNIQGLQDINTAVSLTRSYGRVGEYLGETNRRITKTIETQLEAQQRMQKQVEKNTAAVTNYTSTLDSLKSKYGDSNSAKPITDQSHISQLNTAYQQVEARIAALNNADEHTFATLKAEVDASIQRVKDLATQFQNAEYSANQLAAKPINVIKDNENQALREFEANIKAAGIDSSKFSISISDLREQLDKVGDKKSLSEYLNTLSTVKAEFKALKAEQKAQQKVAQESADVTNGKFKELLNTAKQIDSLEIKIRGLDANSNANQITELSSQLENLRKQYSFLRNGLDGKLSASQLNTLKQTAGDAENRLRVLDSKLEDTKSKIIQTFNNKVKSGDLGLEIEKINTQVTALKTKIDALGAGSVQTELHSTLAQIEIDLDSVNKLAEMFGNSGSMSAEQYIGNMRILEQTINRVKNMTQTATASTRQYATQMEVATLQNRMETWLLKNSKATKQFGTQIRSLINELKDLAAQGNVDKSELNKLANSFKLVDQAATAAGVKGKTFADSLKGALSSISRYISASTLIYSAIRAVKQGITSVVELDTALVDLRKTTDGTAKQLREFYYTANDTAKALGVTTKDVIQAAADWSRLGYSLKDAEEMAKVSSIFKSISPGMGMEQATDGLVSAMKAFDIEANDALDGIASKINAIGNSQAVSNNDIVEFLTRSSSAMKEANNTLDETIALGTAATEITRDAASVGNALKTVSMRIRGYDENTEEFIGGVEILNGEIASLTKTANAPGGISLFKDKDKTEFKSTTELLRDISNIYDELTDKQQANLLEKLAGKRQGQIVAAMLNNFEAVEDSLNTMKDSAGSAMSEMGIIEESLEYKLNSLKETVVGVFQNLFQSDSMKIVLDMLSGILGFVDGLTEKFGLLGTAMLAVPIVAFIKNFGQLKLLGIAGTTSISATAAAIKGLSKEEAIAALATTELNETEMAAALVKAGYTNATATQTAALAVEAREQEAEAAATLESAAADTVATGTTTGLSVATTGLTTVLKGLWATLMANPFVLVLAGLAALIAAVDAYQKRVERAAEALSNSSEEVKSLQSEIDNLNSELKTTQDKIEELLRKPSPTIVEKNELKNLQITNNELERQIKLKERALKVSQGKNADNFVNAVNSKKTENGGDGWWFGYRNYGDFKTSPYKDKDHPNRPEANTTGKNEEQYYMFQVRLEDYQEAEAKYQKALQDGNEQEAKQWEERKTELNTAMSGYVSDMTGYLTDLGEYDYSALSDDAKAAVDYINDIQNAYLMATGNSGDSVFSNIFNQGRFAEGKKAIDELKESGKLTADTLANLYESNSDVKALIDNMKQVGLINDTTADTFNSLTNQIIGTSNALKQANTESIDESNNLFTRLMNETGTSKDPSFVESIEKSIEKLQKLQDALTKVESGTLKDSERMSLFKTFPQLTAYANNLSEGIKHVTESMRGDIVEKFSDQISKFNEQGASASEIAQLEAYQKTVLGIADAVVTTQNALSSMQTVFQDLDKIVKDYNENQYFSLESLEKLSSSSGQKYLQYLTYENGQLKVNEEAYKKLVLAQIDEIETKATLQATTDLESLSSETAAKEYLAKVNIELADSQLTAAQAAFQYALALKLAEGGNVAKAAQKVADNLNTLRNIFASAREQAKSYSGAMLGAATATDKKAKASEKAKDALEKEKTALEHSKEALEQEKKALEKNKSEYEKAKNAIQDLIEWTQKYIKQIKENEIKALEEQKDKFDEIIEKRKEQLQAEKDLHEYEKSLSEKQNTLASNALKAAVASLDDSAAGKKAYKKAQEEYKTSQTDLQDFLCEHEIEVREQALDKLKEDTDKSYQDQIDKIQEFLNNEVAMYREACSMIDNDNGTLYGKLLEYCLNYTTTGRAEFDHMWTEAKSAMDKYNTANLSTIDLINDLQGRIYDVDSAIDTLTTNIETYENRISNLKNQIDDLKDAAIEAKNAIDAANSTPLNPDPTNGKTSLWVKYNGKKYETGYNYNGDTEANRLLAASELTKIIAKDVSGFDNYGLSIVQGLLGVGGNKTGHHWTYTFQGKTYESRAATRDNAIADILSQISKKFGGVYPASASTIYGTIKGYAEGTKAATGGLHIVDEEGLFSEFIPYQVGKGRYSFLPEGNPVFSKAMTNTMFDFASDPTKFVNSIRNESSKSDINTSMVINIQGNADRETIRQLKEFEKKYSNERLMKMSLNNKRII